MKKSQEAQQEYITHQLILKFAEGIRMSVSVPNNAKSITPFVQDGERGYLVVWAKDRRESDDEFIPWGNIARALLTKK